MDGEEITTLKTTWWADVSSNKRALRGVRELLSECDQWDLTSLAAPMEQHSNALTRMSQDSNTLYQTDRVDFDQLLDALVQTDLNASEKAAFHLHLTKFAFKKWASDRNSTSLAIAGSRLQSFLVTISGFVASFSGIVEIVKAADNRYGGLAYGTVSLLLSVAVLKQQREDAIDDAMIELTYAFPRLEILGRLRPNETMKYLVADVFAKIIGFARESIKYYTSSWKRWKSTFDPKTLKMVTMADIRGSLAEIRKETEIIMLQELTRVSQQLKGLTDVTNDTNRRAREVTHSTRKAESRATRDHLARLRLLLGQSDACQQQARRKDVAKYKMLLLEYFRGQHLKHGEACEIDWDLFLERRRFTQWLDQVESSIMLVGGSNLLQEQAASINWLSFLSVFAVDKLLRDCQTNFSTNRKLTFEEVAFSLIYQLALLDPDHLQSKTEAIQHNMWPECKARDPIATTCQLLTEAPAARDEDEQIFIIVDRLDVCRDASDADDDFTVFKLTLDSLLDLVHHPSIARHTIKILLVADSTPARRIAQHPDFATARFVCLPEWDQETKDQREERLFVKCGAAE